MDGSIALWMFGAVFIVLLMGYPVAISLAGTALAFAFAGEYFELFDFAFLEALPNRLFGIIENDTLVAVPLFVFMGVMLEKSNVAEALLENISTRWTWLLGCFSRYAYGCQYRHCWRNGCYHGAIVFAHYVKTQLRPRACLRHYLRIRHIGANYSAVYRTGFIR